MRQPATKALDEATLAERLVTLTPTVWLTMEEPSTAVPSTAGPSPSPENFWEKQGEEPTPELPTFIRRVRGGDVFFFFTTVMTKKNRKGRHVV